MSLPATDNFNRADGALGANWSDVYGANPFTIVTNQAAGSTAADQNASRWSADTFPNDQYCQVTLAVLTNFDGGPGVRVSGTTPATFNGYFLELGTTFGNRMSKWVSGVSTNMGTLLSDYANGDVARIEAIGTTITAYKNGVANGAFTDTDLASGSAGLWCFDNTGRVDTWEGGSLAVGAQIPRDLQHTPQYQSLIAQ